MMSARVGLIRRAVLWSVGAGTLIWVGAAWAQKASAVDGADPLGPAFEVAVVRPAGSEMRHWMGIKLDPSGRLQASQVSLEFLFWQAYKDAPGKQNVVMDHDAPKWVESENFDVNAKVDEAYLRGWDKLSDEQRMERVRPMLRRLLADRFHLKMRLEMRKTQEYVLVQAKGGAHVKEVPAPVAVQGDPMEAAQRWMADHPGQAAAGNIMCAEKCTASAVKMINALGQIRASSQADRMVIDETGLTGYYDFSFASPRSDDERAMQEVEEDLGMKFEPQSVMVKTYVIVGAEKPSVDGD
jgi:uncharacterized protein (TIGR03435 family)